MRIIIENGVLTIKGSLAERKAWDTVTANLIDLQKHAGGDLAESAAATAVQFVDFRAALGGTVEWASERKQNQGASA